jgi:hypothetical protein
LDLASATIGQRKKLKVTFRGRKTVLEIIEGIAGD